MVFEKWKSVRQVAREEEKEEEEEEEEKFLMR
jgi:hypothetical protein